MDWKNRLYFGDNLDILRREVPDGSVDLIYLDPPFNSNATYNVLFKENVAQGPHSGPAGFQFFPAAQITAFEDTWQWAWSQRQCTRKSSAAARASSNDTPCLRTLAAALISSHSN